MGSDKPFMEILGKTSVRFGEQTFEFRHPDEWTIGEVARIEDECTVFEKGLPLVKSELLIPKVIAKACGISEEEASALKYHVAFSLYQLVRWHPVPLGDSLTSNSEQAEGQQLKEGSTEQKP